MTWSVTVIVRRSPPWRRSRLEPDSWTMATIGQDPSTAPGPRTRGSRRRRALGLHLLAAVLSGVVILSGCGSEEPAPTATAAPATTGTEGAASPDPAAAAPSPSSEASGAPVILPGDSPASAATRAGGTQSLRFIARVKETGAEIPAGAFEVRLVSLESMRGGSGSVDKDKKSSGPSAGVTVDPAPRAGSAPIDKAPGGSPASGESYAGPPQQILVTQPDGSQWTFVAGLKPGVYALRVTAKGRRMLLEVLTVHPGDTLVERALERE